MRTPPLLLLLLALSACKLIDQTTFAPSPSENPVFIRAPRVDARTPLVTIDQGTPVAAYSTLLHAAVEKAERRNPRVIFDVTMILPVSADPPAALTAARPEAMAVMHEIIAAGVPETRIHLRAATDTRATARQVRVYVR